MRHNPRAFVRTLAFVTSLGHGVTGRERRALGDHDRRTGARRDRPLHDDARRGDEGVRGGEPAPGRHARAGTREYGLGRPLRRHVAETPAPDKGELEALSDLNERTARAHGTAPPRNSLPARSKSSASACGPSAARSRRARASGRGPASIE